MLILFYDLMDTEEEKQAFDILYDKYHKLMFHIAKKYLSDARDIEDAVQTALIHIAKNIQKFQENIPLPCPQNKNLIVIIVKNVCIDLLRKQSRSIGEVSLDENEELPAAVCQTEDKIMALIQEEELRKILSVLDEDERTMLILHYLHGYSIKEIARQFDRNTEAVKKRIARAIEKCRKESSHEKR